MAEETRVDTRPIVETSAGTLARAGRTVGTALILVAAALLLMSALSVRQSVRSVEATLPCEPNLINNGVSIDPRGYSLYSDEIVAESKALDACMTESLRLIDSGEMVISEVSTPIVTAIAGTFFAALLAMGWTALIAGSASTRLKFSMGLITIVSVAIFVAQLRHGEVLEAIGWITN